jgi:hypothetical protein
MYDGWRNSLVSIAGKKMGKEEAVGGGQKPTCISLPHNVGGSCKTKKKMQNHL